MRILAAIGLSLLASQQAFAVNYFCSAEYSAGFRYVDPTGWRSVTFNTDGDQFTVATQTEFLPESYPYQVTRLGDQEPMLYCQDGEVNIVCGGLLNKTTMRFQTFYGHGYVDDRPTGNTPAITAGKCSKL